MKTILVIDDENMNRMSTKFILEKAGYNVVTAESGDEGIMLLSDIAADLVLLDVEMPDKNGIETLRELRRIPKLSNIRVCFLTASGSQDDLTEAVHLGAKGFIKKPCRPEELAAAVEEAFAKNDDRLMLVIDDETMNQMLLKRIFGREYHVAVEKSGEDGLAFLGKNIPDIILLDLKMQGIDGEETFQRIKQDERLANIPVIFLTADTDRSVEQRLFKMGAMDFIRKPFDPDIVHERVRRIMELQRLQNLLQDEVERKTNDLIHSFNKIQRLSEQIILALSAAIDAKDAYTNGHSDRVAEYSREIAKRMGKNDTEVNDIYYAAMLHDVGKIGIPGEIINKPGRLTDEEFDIIKSHTVKGAKILESISEMPGLSVGARWHHERYDGKGYPNGLKGEDIPETARIICVADCYDAMSSNRSYRKALPQEIVRAEIEKGRGTQFDPAIADIMLKMIDEDADYKMREV
ncbi:MAG: response regulator [Ruminiclostridium sp.]|nr:response regulator [Ruminiclostridium sp.]